MKITHSTPGARSMAGMAVGSHVKRKMTTASTANTAAAR